jgi:DNA-binding MarR family transcriptional regulator
VLRSPQLRARPRARRARPTPAADPSLEDDALELHDALSRVVRLYQSLDRDLICCHDVSVTQCHAIEALVRSGPSGLNELAAALYLDKSTASRVVSALERKRYLRRARHGGDGRAIVLSVTGAGRALHRRIREDLVAEAGHILAAVAPKVRREAARMLRNLAGAAAARTGRPVREPEAPKA